ncbi:MAG: hypothetical protein PHQ34_13050 [Methanothrix sp.]|nr:hypothetical protein [Methanothrix sp.]
MKKKNVILSLLLVSLLTGLSLGQADSNTSTASTNESIPLNDTAGSNAAQTADGINLSYIWSLTGIESGPISMVLNQEGSDLYGQANFKPDEGKAWNADVLGSVDGNNVVLTMTVQKDKEPVTTKMTGTYANDTISGTFTQISAGKKIRSGSFSAMWVSPDTSSYSPAVIEEPAAETPSTAVEETPAEKTPKAESENTTKPASRFVDIHQYVDKIGPGGELSGIPPGMGGSGVGGSGMAG